MASPGQGSRREGRGRFIHSDPNAPEPEGPAPRPAPSRPAPVLSTSKPKSTRRNAAAKETGRVPRAGYAGPKKKDNTLLIVGAAGGGLLLLIVIIAAAASSGSKPRPVERKQAEEAPVAEEKSTVTKQDTGPITFACAGSGGQHPEKESSLTRCPKCNARSRFFWDYAANKFSCFDCKALLEKADVRCPDCGGTPNRDPYIKHRPG